MSRVLTYAEALCEATAQQMEADPGVIVLGIGVDDFKGTYGTTALVDRFGPNRVFDTPLSEEGMTGFAVGAAMAGLRPIHVHIRMDFVMLAMNQIVNFAAKAHYMYGGAVSVPIVVRSIIGRSWGQGPQHAQALHSLFMHIPGLRVIAPTTPYDAKGGLVASIRDDNPVMFVEHRLLHHQHGDVPAEPFQIPLGKARVLTEGRDITIVGVSHVVAECVRACHALRDIGIEAEVIDPVWLAPLDIETIVESTRRTGHLLIVDSGWTNCGASAEIMAQLLELAPDAGIRVQRMGFAPVTCPTTPTLEDLFYPSGRSIAQAAARMLSRAPQDWEPPVEASSEVLEFRGPF